MTREEAVEFARQAGHPQPGMDGLFHQRFANLVAAAERAKWPEEMEAMERQVEILTDTSYTGFQCEPQLPMYEDGFTDWICPKPTGYLMQCCDCNLIHEVETRVAKYEPRPSETYEVVEDPDMQVQWRMKRRDDLAGTND